LANARRHGKPLGLMARTAHAGARLPEIEALRGLAVAGVILHHSVGNLVLSQHRAFGWLMRHADYWTGVDLFFAISGFVIARSLLPGLRACRDTTAFFTVAGAFWIRRAWRLLPSAWLWLALCLLLSVAFNRSGVFLTPRANAWALLAGVFDFANLRFADAMFRYPYGASFAWWSLSLEEQFYLVLPPLAVLSGRFLPLILLPPLIWQFTSHRTLLLMVFRTDAILLGVLLACWEPLPSFRAAGTALGRLPAAAQHGMAAALVVALGVLGTHNPALNRYTIGLIALVSAALVFLAAQDSGLLLPAGRARAALVWLGARSYALYLIHIPAFFAAREIWFRLGVSPGDAVLALTGGVLLFAAAELNWRVVEQPLRSYGARLARRFTARPARANLGPFSPRITPKRTPTR
jgi:peptidoglycan/LPS O-acetylase OafA/YrhL